MTGWSRIVVIQGGNVTQKYQELLQKLATLGGEKLGRHVVHCRLFNRKILTEGYQSQRMFMIRMSQNENLMYAVLSNERQRSGLDIAFDDAEECSILECGLEGANILQQAEIYSFKSEGQFEGALYGLGDLIVSISVFMLRNNVSRGIAIEMQYTPSYTVSSNENIFDEFLQLLAPDTSVRKPIYNLPVAFKKAGLSMDYSLKHTALQYLEAYNILRKYER